MRSLYIAFFAVVAGVFLSSCVSSNLRIDGQPPEAEVFVSINGQTPKSLGKTPLNLTESTLGAQGESFELTIVKEGFFTEHVLVGPSFPARTTDIKFGLKALPKGIDEQVLKQVAQSQRSMMNEEVLQRIASGVAHTIRALTAKQFDQAEQSLATLIAQHPGISTLHELMGNIHYLRKDLAKAMVSYRKALELNPANVETQHMVNKLDTILGDRSPSSSSQGGR